MLINSKFGWLPESERKIAEYIVSNRENVIHQTVSDIAKSTGSSSSAVIRLCKSLGIPSFPDLKIMLARDVFAYENTKKEQDSTDSIVANTIKSATAALKDVSTTINPKEIQKAFELIENAQFISIFGIGQSNAVAIDFSHKLQRLGFVCCTQQSLQAQMMTANNLVKKMLGIIVSHSANTKEMCRAASLMKSHGVPIITLTSNPKGKLVTMSDVVLLSSLSEPFLRSGASSSRIAQLTVIDILFNHIVKSDFKKYSLKLEETSLAYEAL